MTYVDLKDSFQPCYFYSSTSFVHVASQVTYFFLKKRKLKLQNQLATSSFFKNFHMLVKIFCWKVSGSIPIGDWTLSGLETQPPNKASGVS